MRGIDSRNYAIVKLSTMLIFVGYRKLKRNFFHFSRNFRGEISSLLIEMMRHSRDSVDRTFILSSHLHHKTFVSSFFILNLTTHCTKRKVSLLSELENCFGKSFTFGFSLKIKIDFDQSIFMNASLIIHATLLKRF